jgi:predicted AlkP superfamily phosphohydrolase/phosphomutase
MTSPAKVLFIGIDSGDKDLIQQWVAEGALPNLAWLMRNSTQSVTQNPIGLYVGAVWPSFYTGLSPANHGRYCYRQMLPGTYEISDIDSSKIDGTALWNHLSDANKRVAVIDIPKSPPPKPLNGLHIADWGTHDPEFEFQTFPHDLKDDIQASFGIDPMVNCNAFRTDESEFLTFQASLKDRICSRAALTKDILSKGEWDCLFTVFSESHCVGHQCWHIHDRSHIRHDSKIASAIGDPIKSIYVEIDAAIGSILKNIDLNETRVVVLASHGIQSHYDSTFLLDKLLRALEGKSISPNFDTIQAAIKSDLKRIRIGKIRRISPKISENLRRFISYRHYSGCKAFTVPNNDVYGAIRVNVQGREPRGKIKLGKEYEYFCGQLIEDLMGFINVETNQPIVNRILQTKDVYRYGANIDALPDLLIEWNRSSPVSEIYSHKTGIVSGEYKKCRTGDHSESGMVFLTGNGIPVGHLDKQVCIEDIAPTIAGWLGVTLPQTDGHAIPV